MASDPISNKPADKTAKPAAAEPSAKPSVSPPRSAVPLGSPTPRVPTARASTAATLRSLETPALPPRTVKCPKCGADTREVARFCQRCHMTLRFTCPSCKHEQRTGGTCEKCGIDFLKYIGAVVAAKKDEADAAHERLERRSKLLRNILYIPLTGGLSLLSMLRPKRDGNK
jgi:hypothetical protein